MFPVSEEALSETAESTSDEVVMDVLAETEETVLTGTEDAAPVQADNKTVKAVETAKITLRTALPISVPAFPATKKEEYGTLPQ